MEQDQKEGKPMQVTVVTLLVNPEHAERLALASTEGKIQLALRNPLDQGSPNTPGIRPAGLLSTTKQPAPAAPRARTSQARVQPMAQPQVEAPAPPPAVEMIRGDKRSTEIIK
jgi:pilus assembly protein CpaB